MALKAKLRSIKTDRSESQKLSFHFIAESPKIALIRPMTIEYVVESR